jgi:UDP-N-acetylmuramate dehydrogenase
MEIQEGVPLAPLTTFRIGGNAKFFAHIKDLNELFEALAFVKEKQISIFILGGGSNSLVDDAGFDGLVLKVELPGIESVEEDEGVLVVSGAGESWDAVVEKAVQAGWWGIENLSGIPGTVGGAVVQNIGAYGAVISQVLEWVEVYDREKEAVRTLTVEACKFGYRDSVFKQEPGRYVVLHAALRLSKDVRSNLSYKDLAEKFAGETPSLAQIRNAVLDIRKAKFPDLAVEGTAGSFFKNPVLPIAEAKKLQEKFPEMPTFSLPESADIKIPLGWILDRALNLRGFKEGGARLFERQALVIAAQKNTSSRDVKNLASIVQKKVFDACGLKIVPEVFFVE